MQHRPAVIITKYGLSCQTVVGAVQITCLHDNKHAGKRVPMFLSRTGSRKCSVPAGGVDGTMMMCDCEPKIITTGDVEIR